MTAAEMKKTKFVSNLRNQNGVDYAPWMNINAEDEAKIRQLVKEKAEARRKRALQEQEVRGNLLEDSQAQELSGGGLRAKAIGEDSVELEWSTTGEANTEGEGAGGMGRLERSDSYLPLNLITNNPSHARFARALRFQDSAPQSPR